MTGYWVFGVFSSVVILIDEASRDVEIKIMFHKALRSEKQFGVEQTTLYAEQSHNSCTERRRRISHRLLVCALAGKTVYGIVFI